MLGVLKPVLLWWSCWSERRFLGVLIKLHIFSECRSVTHLNASLKPSSRDEPVISSIWPGWDCVDFTSSLCPPPNHTSLLNDTPSSSPFCHLPSLRASSSPASSHIHATCGSTVTSVHEAACLPWVRGGDPTWTTRRSWGHVSQATVDGF